MRKPNQIAIDRALLLYLLQLGEGHGIGSDVKLQQLTFLAELQMFGKGLKGFHFEIFRFAYGAFSKDLDNDLTSLRRKERVENFSLSDNATEAVEILLKGVEGVETNEKVVEILQAVLNTYGPQESSVITKSVEEVELVLPEDPDQKLPIRDISFHSTLLVPSRIEVQGEFTLPQATISKLNAAMRRWGIRTRGKWQATSGGEENPSWPRAPCLQPLSLQLKLIQLPKFRFEIRQKRFSLE